MLKAPSIIHRQRRKMLLILPFLLVCLILGAYFGRGWIRASLLPRQVSYFAKKSLQQSYKQSHQSISQPLNDFKLKLDPEVRTDCDLLSAEGFQTSIACRNGSGGELKISDEYISSFKQDSKATEQKILHNGWTKTWNANQPISELFDNPSNNVSIGVNYEKKYGKNVCTVSFFYNAYENNPSKLHYSLSCERYIYYLGNPDA